MTNYLESFMSVSDIHADENTVGSHLTAYLREKKTWPMTATRPEKGQESAQDLPGRVGAGSGHAAFRSARSLQIPLGATVPHLNEPWYC